MLSLRELTSLDSIKLIINRLVPYYEANIKLVYALSVAFREVAPLKRAMESKLVSQRLIVSAEYLMKSL
jgi:hypothetical protein